MQGRHPPVPTCCCWKSGDARPRRRVPSAAGGWQAVDYHFYKRTRLPPRGKDSSPRCPWQGSTRCRRSGWKRSKLEDIDADLRVAANKRNENGGSCLWKMINGTPKRGGWRENNRYLHGKRVMARRHFVTSPGLINLPKNGHCFSPPPRPKLSFILC